MYFYIFSVHWLEDVESFLIYKVSFKSYITRPTVVPHPVSIA